MMRSCIEMGIPTLRHLLVYWQERIEKNHKKLGEIHQCIEKKLDSLFVSFTLYLLNEYPKV